MLKKFGITGIRFMNMALALTLMWVRPVLSQIPAKTIPAFSFKKQDNTEFTHRNLKVRIAMKLSIRNGQRPSVNYDRPGWLFLRL
jgi:hypothetical protein